MNPLIGFALHHAEQPALHHLERIGLQVGEQEEQPILGCRQGTVLYTVNWRAVRGLPSRRQAAICAWNAASKGGTSYWNSSSVMLVKSRNSVGRDCISVNRKPAMERASCYSIVLSEAHHIINRDKLSSVPEAPRVSIGSMYEL